MITQVWYSMISQCLAAMPNISHFGLMSPPTTTIVTYNCSTFTADATQLNNFCFFRGKNASHISSWFSSVILTRNISLKIGGRYFIRDERERERERERDRVRDTPYYKMKEEGPAPFFQNPSVALLSVLSASTRKHAHTQTQTKNLLL